MLSPGATGAMWLTGDSKDCRVINVCDEADISRQDLVGAQHHVNSLLARWAPEAPALSAGETQAATCVLMYALETFLSGAPVRALLVFIFALAIFRLVQV